jgi:hypothetical protein
MQEAEEEESRGVDLKTRDAVWKAQFVRAMNNLAARDIQHEKARGRGVKGHAGSQGSSRATSVAESAADRARARIGEMRSEKGGSEWDRSSKAGDREDKVLLSCSSNTTSWAV